MPLIDITSPAHQPDAGRRRYKHHNGVATYYLVLYAVMYRSRVDSVVLEPTTRGSFIVLPREEFLREWERI